ncbi:hypothetical protein CH295_18050 [Rhodococcus sp. 14-2483-1-2]|nr:hypothetical protein CH295_18050 [Rhodococcus sp. 14-2483-1-2]
MVPKFVTIGALNPLQALTGTTPNAETVDRWAMGVTPAPKSTTMMRSTANVGRVLLTLRFD